jgi:hypothetical protein
MADDPTRTSAEIAQSLAYYDPTSGPPIIPPDPSSPDGEILYGELGDERRESYNNYAMDLDQYDRQLEQYEEYLTSQQDPGSANPAMSPGAITAAAGALGLPDPPGLPSSGPPAPGASSLGPVQQKPAVDLGDPLEAESFEKMSLPDQIAFSGIGGSKRRGVDVPKFIKTPAEKVLDNGNAFIVLGVDRSGNPFEGYGGLGNTHCAAIDIVAGRMGARARSRDDSKPFPKPVWTNVGFIADAARVYISQKSNVDAYFGLAAGTVGNTSYESPRSTVALKADTIRIIGREGIKLVTNTDTQNSQGGVVHGSPGIDLIANNNDEDMQPLVKGNNLIEALKEILKLIDDLRDLFNNFVSYQKDLNRTLMTHSHYSPFYGAATSPDPQVIRQATQFLIDTVRNVELGAQNHMMNSVGISMNYLELPLPGKDSTYINSTNNHTN